MTIDFTTKQLCYISALAWKELPFLLQRELNDMVKLNPALTYQHSVTIDTETLLRIYRHMSRQREGHTAKMNNEIDQSLSAQLIALSGKSWATLEADFISRAAQRAQSTMQNPVVLPTLPEVEDALEQLWLAAVGNAAYVDHVVQNGLSLLTQ